MIMLPCWSRGSRACLPELLKEASESCAGYQGFGSCAAFCVTLFACRSLVWKLLVAQRPPATSWLPNHCFGKTFKICVAFLLDCPCLQEPLMEATSGAEAPSNPLAAMLGSMQQQQQGANTTASGGAAGVFFSGRTAPCAVLLGYM
eukprot:1152034-Pelagomonas_calceolata.AAC.5